MCSLFYLKAKNEEKLEKIFFDLFLGQKPFLPFLKNKKYYTISNFEIYFCQLVFDVKGRFMPT